MVIEDVYRHALCVTLQYDDDIPTITQPRKLYPHAWVCYMFAKCLYAPSCCPVLDAVVMKHIAIIQFNEMSQFSNSWPSKYPITLPVPASIVGAAKN